MTLDAELYNTLPIPVDNVKLFFKNTLPGWDSAKTMKKKSSSTLDAVPEALRTTWCFPFRCLEGSYSPSTCCPT
ncbi:hypothetical protein CEXT_537421 [Caerostris extrusa]|uniref:Uncharacterized protein n=1 Tax=Caerostris extrusa TaxID=172846 RepID=A0AAV4XIX4_CAEEX|nr:hypothetical protein CEXT_537421 [Caerostris extrusa]